MIENKDFIMYEATLTPCPFCGSATQTVYGVRPKDGWGWWVQCTECRTSTGHWDDQQTALEMWNRRFRDDDIEEDGYITWKRYRDRYVREFSASLEGRYGRTD